MVEKALTDAARGTGDIQQGTVKVKPIGGGTGVGTGGGAAGAFTSLNNFVGGAGKIFDFNSGVSDFFGDFFREKDKERESTTGTKTRPIQPPLG